MIEGISARLGRGSVAARGGCARATLTALSLATSDGRARAPRSTPPASRDRAVPRYALFSTTNLCACLHRYFSLSVCRTLPGNAPVNLYIFLYKPFY